MKLNDMKRKEDR